MTENSHISKKRKKVQIMRGGVRKKGDSWYYYFEAGKVNGKRKKIERKGGTTQKEALASLRKAISEFENCGSLTTDNNTSVSDYMEYWFNEYVLINCKHNTQVNYRSILDRHINPKLGMYKMKFIQPTVLQEFINDKYREGFAKKTLSIIHCVLSSAFKKAVYPWKIIKENPMQYVKIPKFDSTLSDKEDLKIITIDVYKKICSFLNEENSFYIPFHIAFNTGLRVSEVCALTWDNIDFKNKTLKVDKILVNNNKEWIFGTPKTRTSYRTIKIGDTLVSILKKKSVNQKKNKLKYGVFYNDSDFICTKENGDPITPSSVKYSTRHISEKLEIRFNFHSLRHTHATMLLESGANIKDIQSRLGHSRIGITLDTYSHLTEKMKNETVDIFEAILQKESK